MRIIVTLGFLSAACDDGSSDLRFLLSSICPCFDRYGNGNLSQCTDSGGLISRIKY